MAWALHTAGIEHLIHYLDDFLFLVAPHSELGAYTLALTLATFSRLGIQVSAHKTEGPACRVILLGILLGFLLDTLAGLLQLLEEKLRQLQELIQQWVGRSSCTHKELECFPGHLCQAATVVRPGRTFLRELFRLLHGAKLLHHFIWLIAGARADILWWRCLLQHWLDHAIFPLQDIAFHVYSNASRTWGCGAIADGIGWFQM